jgi:hypothetical protein
LIFAYFLVFLFPLGVYLLFLANINRRQKPVMIPGVWDAVLLSLALAGIFLWIGPAVLGTFYERGLIPGAGEVLDRQFEHIWATYPWIWITYYFLVVCGQGLMILSRRNTTSVYNVDAAALEALVTRLLGERGYATSVGNGLIVFTKMNGQPVSDVAQSFASRPLAMSAAAPPAESVSERGAVDVESFHSLRHATLRWHNASPNLRRAIELDLAGKLSEAALDQNPATSWLLGTSGMIFGFVILGAVMLILAKLIPVVRF